ncbi:spore protease [Thermanaeromonas toyohensis ToBE]|uniref:Germination protease n=1 Tax=Thermanaeromonas toyohensis ToBE TaxID=698762 RepID=A0A1W1VN17_9FIRM|nr:GPR endopeptidase [Thermanaeromonas toyohensis]SMB94747.1 spore protease [Thermanaeromonas toyohensis ToBE]
MDRYQFYRACGVNLDLAVEAHALLRGATKQEIPGVKEDKEHYPQATVTTIHIFSATGAQALGKPPGTYITIEAPGLLTANPPVQEAVAQLLAQKLTALLQHLRVGPTDPVLVVGLGNWQATPDSLGPKVIGEFTVTRHLFQYAPQTLPPGSRPVSALSPGVLGTTGIETAEIIRGVVDRTQPRAIIAIDALAAGDLRRIGTSIQITDTGISPGSGVGKQRTAINRETMGIPVIAVGIPTVVHAAVIIYETLAKTGQGIERSPWVQNPNWAQGLVQEILKPFGGNLTVTPKEIDELIHNLAWVVGAALNQTLHTTLLQTKMAIPLH